jgi:hypothetical protein
MDGDTWKKILVGVITTAILGYGAFSLAVYGHIRSDEAQPEYVTMNEYKTEVRHQNETMRRIEAKLDAVLAKR